MTRQEVHRWERGSRKPKFWMEHLATVLDVAQEDLEAASVVPLVPELDKLLPENPTSPVLSLRSRRRIGTDGVEYLRSRVHALRLADDVIAGQDLILPAFRELDSAIAVLRETSQTDQVRTELHRIVGEFAQIAGWIASDAGEHTKAERTYRLGLDAAREAGDSTLAGQLAGSLAYQWTNLGREKDGLDLAEAAVAEAGTRAPGRAQALFWDRVAWANAKIGDAAATTHALDAASAALTKPIQDDEPSWLYWVDAEELTVMEARAYTELRKPLRAIPLLNTVLARYNPSHTREFALYYSWLAIAYCDANEPEHAAEIARQLFDMAHNLRSARTHQRAKDVRTKLTPHHHLPTVKSALADTR